MPHTDGPMFYPTICTISLGSHTVLEFYSELEDTPTEENSREASTDKTRKHVTSLLVKPRSLLVLKEKMYHELMHGISEVTEDTVSEALARRDLMTSLREQDWGGTELPSGGPPPMNDRARSHFLNTLDRLITKSKKAHSQQAK